MTLFVSNSRILPTAFAGPDLVAACVHPGRQFYLPLAARAALSFVKFAALFCLGYLTVRYRLGRSRLLWSLPTG